MEEKLALCRRFVHKIIKNLGRADVDWTVQVSINSFQPDKINYCCQIEAPANGLQPITFVKNSWEELLETLDATAGWLDRKAVDKAYYEAELKRATDKVKYFEDALRLLDEES